MCYLLTNIPLKTSSQTDRPFTHCQKVTFSFFQRVSQTRCRARCCKGQSLATFPLTNRALLLPSPTFLARPAISAAGSCFQPVLASPGSHKGIQGSWLPAYGVRCVHTRSPTTIPWHRLTQGSALLLCEPFLRAFGGGGGILCHSKPLLLGYTLRVYAVRGSFVSHHNGFTFRPGNSSANCQNN